jgi:hypothetical protein
MAVGDLANTPSKYRPSGLAAVIRDFAEHPQQLAFVRLAGGPVAPSEPRAASWHLSSTLTPLPPVCLDLSCRIASVRFRFDGCPALRFDFS